MIHIRGIWRCIPGATVAHRTQINGTVSYHIVSGKVGATFKGAGSVFFKQNDRRDTLTGTLELALLRPQRRIVADSTLFERAELMGEFRAKRDPRLVVRTVNEMDAIFSQPPKRSP